MGAFCQLNLDFWKSWLVVWDPDYLSIELANGCDISTVMGRHGGEEYDGLGAC